MHLVDIPGDRLRQHVQPMDEGIGGDLEKGPLPVAEAPNELIEERVPFRVGVADDGTDDLHRSPRQQQRGAARRRRVPEEILPPLLAPEDALRGRLGADEPPTGRPEPLEIRAAAEGDLSEALSH
jgi:hypothetical protein